MCGFVGIYDPSGFAKDRLLESLNTMNSKIAHRGPDDSGLWIDTEFGIGMGHRRLAIQDLSYAGHHIFYQVVFVTTAGLEKTVPNKYL